MGLERKRSKAGRLGGERADEECGERGWRTHVVSSVVSERDAGGETSEGVQQGCNRVRL